jgi:hypothetical protein
MNRVRADGRCALTVLRRSRRIVVWAIVPVLLAAISGCGHGTASPCGHNAAKVGSQAISWSQYRTYLRYSLSFYETRQPGSKYYNKQICQDPSLEQDCATIKRELLQRLIDDQVIDAYAAKHNLLPTAKDWETALSREQSLASSLGGEKKFIQYLGRMSIDQADLRWLEGLQIETAKVRASVGREDFASWLASRESHLQINRCVAVGSSSSG